MIFQLHNLHAPCYCNKSPMQSNEQEKKRAYEERVREIEHGFFAPLVFSISGGMGPIATTVYKRMVSPIAEKHNHPYSSILFWLRCKLSFSLLRSAIMCVRGSGSSYHRPTNMFSRPSIFPEFLLRKEDLRTLQCLSCVHL